MEKNTKKKNPFAYPGLTQVKIGIYFSVMRMHEKKNLPHSMIIILPEKKMMLRIIR